MEDRIRKAVEEALREQGAEDVAFAVERPASLTHGDYAVNAALVAAKALGKSPREVADAIAKDLQLSLGTDAAKIDIAGPGFVNITLSKDAVARAVDAAAKEDWGNGDGKAGKRVLIEYSNPNAFKEMHAGHLVGTVIGEALSRFLENDGATVMRDTFGGDVGPNVAKALWGLRKAGNLEPASAKEIGEAYAAGSNAYETDEAAKQEIDALNQAIYAGNDEAVMDLWHRGREISMEEFRRIWKLLGTHFDYEFFDSDTTETGVRVVRDGLEKGIFKMSDGAVVYGGEAKGVHTMVFITSHDTPTYEAKDIGLAFLKEERVQSDEIIILTGNEQTGRFKTVLAALHDIAPLVADKMRHVATGFLRLTSGKMSSREGNVITAAELLEDVMQRAGEKNPDPLIAEQVAVGAVKYMILRQSPGADIIFDPEKSLSLEGDSGPYLQYALVRARKILSYATDATEGTSPAEPYDIERTLIHFPRVAARAAREFAPQLLTAYLTELAGAWNSFYASEQVLGSPEEAYKIRVARAFAHTMERGLSLLGIPAPERM
jgi:arginyl-tRNA synthetase